MELSYPRVGAFKRIVAAAVFVLAFWGISEACVAVATQQSQTAADPAQAEEDERAYPAAARFQTLPGYANYEKMQRSRREFGKQGRVADIEWLDDGRGVNFTIGGDDYSLQFETGKVGEGKLEGGTTKTLTFNPRPRWDPAVGRAQQAKEVTSPDEKWTAKFVDNNVQIVSADGNQTIFVTEDGTDRHRYGTGCWVYGEELYQSQAMWWSPDSKMLVYYEMDEEHMRDYFLTVNNAVNPLDDDADLYTELDIVRYPTAGMPNPNVALHVYDLENGSKRKIPFEGPKDQYLFNCLFAPDGRLLVNRTNRHQNHLQVMAVDLNDMSISQIVSEKQSTWQNNRPLMYFLSDSNRFLWETEKSMWKHFEVRDMSGNLVNPLTDGGDYPVLQILRLDEKAGYVYFSAFSDQENPLCAHLHRVRLDGTDHQKLTVRQLNHTRFWISPDSKWFVTTAESVNHPPVSLLYDMQGNEVAELATGTNELAEEFGLSLPELFHFPSADGKFEIYGVLHKPSNFNPNRKYPLVIDVYGGPQSSGPANVYSPSNPNCEFGYLIAKIGNRGTNNRGKAFESSNYLKLGQVDIEDQADGVRFLARRGYVDGERVGIYGHSYGGYMSALAVMKYPDVFHVAVSGAPVTDWRNYDTIYTERYMRTPQENKSGYNEGSCFKYVENLRGNLLLVHGLIDDNVHPSNSLQLVNEFHQQNVRFDVQVFPNNKHGIGGPYNEIRWEYFDQHLQPSVSDRN